MKKRILGLALALVMIISLLPLTTFAATPQPKFILSDVNLTDGILEGDVLAGTPVYIVYENVEEGGQVIGTKPVLATGTPTDNYILLAFDNTQNVLNITFKNITYNRTATTKAFLTITNNTGADYNNEFAVALTLEGTNTISGENTNLIFENAGALTITGSGSLNIDTHLASSSALHKRTGDLTIKDTTVNIVLAEDKSSTTGCIVADGQITFDNANIDINGYKCYMVKTGPDYKTLSDDTTKGITIKNGSNVKIVGGNTCVVNTNGEFLIENSSVEISKATVNKQPAFNKAPKVDGSHSSVMYGARAADTVYDLEAGTPITTTSNILFFKAVHECVPVEPDDGDCMTALKCSACGNDILPAKDAHIAGANADDCTKDTICGNEGCTQVYAPKTADAHVPGADDGDCTTAVKCTTAGCEKNAIEAKPHEGKDGTYSCDQAHPCKNCDKNYREAGQHIGGGTEATCQKKAVCSCGQEYGELAACTPAADDGDCMTAVKCSVCGKETKAAEKAHKYTDKNDTTCDNAGCTNTRKVEGTENPKTGDNTALVLMVSLMATAAAAFVCTKKFAR